MYLYVQDSIEKILIKKAFLQMIDSDILPLRFWEMAETKTFTIPPCMCTCVCVGGCTVGKDCINCLLMTIY